MYTMEYYSATEKEWNLNNLSQPKCTLKGHTVRPMTSTIWFYLHVESKKQKKEKIRLKKTENRSVFARGGGWRVGEKSGGAQKTQTSSYK